MQYDYLIIGRGIAGTCLALHLCERKKNFLIISESPIKSASGVAAGLMNPVVVKRLAKSRDAEIFIPYNHTFYKKWENLLQEQFYKPIPFYRIFPGQHEADQWENKLEENPFLSKQLYSYKPEVLHLNEAGGAEILNGAKVNSEKFLNSAFTYFKNRDAVLEEKFNYKELIQNEDGTFSYKNLMAQKIIFCEGLGVVENPWFQFLKFYPSKGDVLIVEVKNAEIDKVLVKNIFVAPTENGLYEVGSTYYWGDKIPDSDEAGKKDLETKLETILSIPFQTIGQKSGIRPASIDRMPMMGPHPEIKNMYCFNGLGTKGYMTAPLHAEQLIEFCEGKYKIPKEFLSERFLEK